MTMNEFLDRYISSSRGEHSYCIEFIWGRTIQGGIFSYKQDARNMLLRDLVAFLDDPAGTVLAAKQRKKVAPPRFDLAAQIDALGADSLLPPQTRK